MTSDGNDAAALHLASADLADEVVRLYSDGLSTRRIGAAVGLGRQVVTRILRRAGVQIAPRGAGRARPTARLAGRPELTEHIRELYVERHLTRARVADILGIGEAEVRSRMAAAGIPTRTRGQFDRADRRHFDPTDIEDLYVGLEFTADEVGDRLHASRHTVLRTAHDLGLPVRFGGDRQALHGPADIELIRALYDDPLVADVVARYDLPVRPAGSSIDSRFPVPVELTRALLADLYEGCGLSAFHIELLTGEPAATVRRRLKRWGIALRPPGGRSPFRIRQRHDQMALRRREHALSGGLLAPKLPADMT